MSEVDRYRQLVELASDAIFITDEGGAIVEVNHKGCEMFRYESADLIGEKVTALVEPEHLARNPLRFDLVLAGQNLVVERVLLRSDGSSFDGELSVKMLPDRSVLGIVRDISRRKESERALQDSERRFRTIVEQSPLATALYQADGTLIETNKASDEMWSISPEVKAQIQGQYNVLEDPQLVESGLMPYIQRGFAGEAVEIPVVHYDPEKSPALKGKQMREFWVRGHVYPVRNVDGQIQHVVLIHEDVTALKTAERDKVEMVEQIQETQKLESLGVLAGGVAHDFNNVLTSILGHASLASETIAPGTQAAESLEAIEKSAQHAAGLCRQLLAYAGKGQFLVETMDVSTEVRSMVGMLALSVSKKATLRQELPEGLPGVKVDATQFRQIVMNLITNASDALDDEGGVITVKTGADSCSAAQLASTVLGEGLEPGPYVFVEVADTGAGMTPETVAKMFDPFFTTRFTGRGLGLAAVLGILRGHGGTIEVDTAPGEGTRVRVLFPATDAVDTAARPEECATEPDAEHRCRVLVVDDDAAILRLVNRGLTAGGYEVIAAADGTEGLACFEEHAEHLCLVILDKTMPGASGDEVLARMRALGSKVPAILSSGYSEDATDRDPSLEPYQFLQKPYRIQDLLALVDELAI